MKIRKKHIGDHGLRCKAPLRIRNKWGDAQRKRWNMSLDVCGNKATHIVDDIPMCMPHAAKAALEHVMKEG